MTIFPSDILSGWRQEMKRKRENAEMDWCVSKDFRTKSYLIINNCTFLKIFFFSVDSMQTAHETSLWLCHIYNIIHMREINNWKWTDKNVFSSNVIKKAGSIFPLREDRGAHILKQTQVCEASPFQMFHFIMLAKVTHRVLGNIRLHIRNNIIWQHDQSFLLIF